MTQFWEEYLSTVQSTRFDAISAVVSERCPPAIVRRVDAAVVNGLKTLARARRLTLRSLLLTAYLEGVERIAAGEPSAVGVVTNGRSERLSDPLRANGLFWQFVPVALSDAKTPGERVLDVHDKLRSIEGGAGYPVQRLLDQMGRAAPFDATFSYVHFRNAPWAVPRAGMGTRRRRVFDHYHFPLNISLEATGDGDILDASFTYSPQYFHEEDLAHLITVFLERLRVLAAT